MTARPGGAMRHCLAHASGYVTRRMAAVPAPLPRKLSEELEALRVRTAERAATLGEVVQVMHGRAYLLLVMLIALPFLTPIPMVGLSTPFGAVIAVVALRLSLGMTPWLPQRLLRREVPAGFVGRLIPLAAGIVRGLEKLLRPRLAVVTAHGALNQVHALAMLVCALALMLPLPIPFTNSLPAWAILLLAGGLVERDGLAIALGYTMAAVTAVYFFVLGEAAGQIAAWLQAWWHR